MLTNQEIEAIIEQFRMVNYQDFTLEALSQIASRLNWELILSRGGGCMIYCKFTSTGRRWAFGYSESDDCRKLDWFLITLYLWKDWHQEDFETIEAYQLKWQQYDNYYVFAKQQLAAILGEPVFSATQNPKDYKQTAWLLTNGIMYLYQDERDVQFGIEVGLFFQPWDHKDPIEELKFEP